MPLEETGFTALLTHIGGLGYPEQRELSSHAARVLHYPERRDMKREDVAKSHARLNELAAEFSQQTARPILSVDILNAPCVLSTQQLQTLRLVAI